MKSFAHAASLSHALDPPIHRRVTPAPLGLPSGRDLLWGIQLGSVESSTEDVFLRMCGGTGAFDCSIMTDRRPTRAAAAPRVHGQVKRKGVAFRLTASCSLRRGDRALREGRRVGDQAPCLGWCDAVRSDATLGEQQTGQTWGRGEWGRARAPARQAHGAGVLFAAKLR